MEYRTLNPKPDPKEQARISSARLSKYLALRPRLLPETSDDSAVTTCSDSVYTVSGFGVEGLRAYKGLALKPDVTSHSDPIRVPSIHFRRHPGAPSECASHDNVQIRHHPCPQSIHGPTMRTSRSDPIHARRASMGQPRYSEKLS